MDIWALKFIIFLSQLYAVALIIAVIAMVILQNKLKLLKIQKILIIFFFTFLSVLILTVTLVKCNIYFYAFGYLSDDKNLFFAALMIISGTAAIMIQIWRIQFKKLLIRVASSALTLVFLFGCYIIFSMSSFLSGSPTFYTNESPDSEQSLLIEESSSLFSGFGNIYLKIMPSVYKKIGSYNTGDNDGFLPFTNNDYWFEWEDDYVTLYYNDATGKECYSYVRMSLTGDNPIHGVSNIKKTKTNIY